MVNFPTSLDSFIDPVLTDTLNSPPHHTQHGDINHAVEALETKLGIDSSTPVANSVLTGTGTGHSSWQAPSGGGGLAISSSYATRPAAGTAGRYWKQTDGPFSAIDTGSVWQEYCFGQLVHPQALPTTWRNQDGATIDTSKGGAIMDRLSVNNAESLMIREENLSSFPYTVTLAFEPQVTLRPQGQNDYTYWAGIALIESSTGKIVTLSVDNHFDNSHLQISVDIWTNVTTYLSNITKWDIYVASPMIWLRIFDDGAGAVNFYWGLDENNMVQFGSTTHGNGFTTAPDKVGYHMDKSSTGGITPTPHTNTWFTSWEHV